MSGLLPRSENHATKIVPSCARRTLGSSSLVGLPTESRIGWPGANASGSAGECESLHETPMVISAAPDRVRNLTDLVDHHRVLSANRRRAARSLTEPGVAQAGSLSDNQTT